MADDRREALKIIGAIGTTCAFPFSADELYGQHAHPAGVAPQAALPAEPLFLTSEEMETVSRLADLIIPATDTPGALAAGVPGYIDLALSKNTRLQAVYRDGLRWLDEACGKRFVSLTEAEQIEFLQPWVEKADQQSEPDDLPVRFVKAVKGMTADGYFTSKAGLIDELGYRGNTVLNEFPVCIHEH